MPKNPLAIYEARLAAGDIRPDEAQRAAALALDGLYAAVLQAHAPSPKSFIARVAGSFMRKRVSPPGGLYLYGGVGRGKSMLMDLFYGALPPGIKKQRVHFHAFMIGLHDYLHQRRESGEAAAALDGLLPMFAARLAERTDVLCFDEFHVTDVADAMILGRLFTSLFERGVSIVATSNWPPDRLYEGGLQRERFLPFIDLLKRKMTVMALDGPVDYRTQFLREEGTYFHPLGEFTRARAQTLFEHLTQGTPAHTDVLEVKGRSIKVAEAAGGVARFTFAQLCEQPHGAEDFLAIAARYHTVFLEGVPKIGYDRRNEAKRFMILIDALYEGRRRLVITADAPPEKLYVGHDHGFEFERTVSRLQEMQSPQYLAA